MVHAFLPTSGTTASVANLRFNLPLVWAGDATVFTSRYQKVEEPQLLKGQSEILKLFANHL
jgi:hypothetical protein